MRTGFSVVLVGARNSGRCCASNLPCKLTELHMSREQAASRSSMSSTCFPSIIQLPQVNARASPMSILASTSSRSLVRGAVVRARSLHCSAATYDHYRTLEVPRTASKRDIKAQFYKLSKKWHPDVNQDDARAKTRFQEVSEAWATLGDERARRDYDRRMSEGSYGGSSSSMSPRGSYDSSDNTQRRARATYAWEYQRKYSGPRTARSASSTYHRHGSTTSSSTASGAGASAAAGFGFGSGGVGQGGEAEDSATFERYKASNARRERAAAARAADAGRASDAARAKAAWEEEAAAQTSSPIIRFAQVAGVFFLTYWLGSSLGGGAGGGSTAGNEKYRSRKVDAA